jgi:hypothetical protein
MRLADMNVIAFNGSARPNGNTSILIKTVFQELASQGIETELINLAGKNLKGCIACFIGVFENNFFSIGARRAVPLYCHGKKH